MDNRNLQLVQRFLQLPLAQRRLFLDKLASKGLSLAQMPIPTVREAVEVLPLSFAQQRQWFLWQWEPLSALYNIPLALTLKGPLDLPALQRSFDALAARHESLRTTFHSEAQQVIHAEAAITLQVEPVSAAPLLEQVSAEAARPFDLEHGPLLRVKLLQRDEQDHVLILTVHHIVADGWSLPVMVDELVQLYDGFTRNAPAQLPALPIQYADYALWQRRWMEAGEQERQLAYWSAELGAEQPLLELPANRPRPAISSHAGARLPLTLGEPLVAAIKTLAQQHGTTPFVVLLASFQALLHRYSGQADIRVGVPVANRNRVETEGLIGFFVNTQVLRAEFDQDPSFSALLAQVKQRALGAQAHQDLPFEQLVDALQPERSLSHSPLFQVMYNHQTQARGSRRHMAGLQVEELLWSHDSAKFDLTLDTFEHDGGISAALTYATDLFDEATVAQMGRHWLNLLKAAVQHPQRAVAELDLLDDAEQQQLLYGWNATEAEYPSSLCLHQLFEAQAAASPNARAMLFGDTGLTYVELNHRANTLAHKLRELGVGPDVLVAIAMERGLEMVVGLLAILKAGGAYVPLDPDYPQARLEYMLEDSQARAVLSQSSLLERLPEAVHARTLLLDTLDLSAYPTGNPTCHTTPENLAYSIYTSGSTGLPKGVLIEHRNACALVGWALSVYSREQLSGVLAATSICFDLSVWELFVTLAAGGYAVIARNALELPSLPARDQVRLVNTVPSAIQALLESGGLPPSVRTVNLAGEALKQSLVDALYQTDHIEQVYDLYGPSEDTTYSTFTLRQAGGTATIGRPISNSAAYILGSAGQVMPIGAAGELYMAGAGLARGYLNRPSLTAERFVPNPFDAEGGRFYRTGDLARYRPDGQIQYAGRLDHQVKVRGFRIELGEIEARLHAHPDVSQVALLAVDGPSGQQLVGYLVPTDGAVVGQPERETQLRDTLREALRAQLPDYMVPAHLLLLDRLPLTPNGKLDRKALPQPDTQLPSSQYVAPRSELEQQLATLWAEVLKREQVGLTDNFFELGGDSIISLQVVSRARQLNIQFTPKELFQHQTVQGLATVARRHAGSAIEQGRVQGRTPLVPIQQWFFEQPVPVREHWNQAVLLAPNQPLQVVPLSTALQALVEHHDALRLRFTAVDGEWQAAFTEPSTELLWQREAVDAEALPAMAEQAQTSLDLVNGPLLRAVLVTLNDGSQRLLLVVHHLVVDGVSWRVLLEDLQQAYQALVNGQPVTLPSKTSSFKTWAERLVTHAQSPALRQELHYWQEQLQGLDTQLPCDYPAGANLEKHAASVSTHLDAQWTRRLLQEAPAAYRTQINDLLLTALARVISRWTGQAEVLVRLEGHGREDLFDDIDLTRTVGWFTSLYPVRLSPQQGLAGSIKTVKEQLRAVPDKGLGYGLLRYSGDAGTRHTLAQLPVGEIVFNYLGQFDASFDQDTGLFTPAQESSGTARDPEAALASLLAINGQVYGGELRLGWSFSREVFEPATLQRLADELGEELKALIEHCCSGEQGATPSDFPLAALSQAQVDALPATAAQIADVYPLSPMQQGMLFHSQYEQGTGAYINQMRVDVEGLDGARFLQAWRETQQAHDILRSSFVWDGAFEQPLQIVHKQVEAGLRELDLRAQTDLPAVLEQLAATERAQGFDLGQAPLMRLTLACTGTDSHHLIFTHHHILMDGWSTSRLLGEVLQRYADQAVASQAGHYRDYIGWLQRQDGALAQAFWTQQMQALEEPTLLLHALNLTQDPGQRGQGEHHQLFDRERTQRLEAFARRQRVTVNTVLQAAWLLLLQRYTGHSTVCFGATVAGRPAELAHVEEQIGLFINTLPVVGTPRVTQTVSEWLSDVQASNLALREFEHTPLNDVQRLAGRGGHALFDSLMVFENYPVSEALAKGAPSDLRFGPVANHEQTNYPLTLLVGTGATLSMQFNYDRALWPTRAVEDLARHLNVLIDGMITSAQAVISELPMLAAEEQQKMLHGWNATAASVQADFTVQQLIEAQVRATPESMAVVCGEQALSYDALNRRANRLAHHLRTLGVGPDVLVGVALERSVEMVVGLLAILKAGGAYVPLDPESPAERLAYLFADSGIAVLLTQRHLQADLPAADGLQTVLLDDVDALASYSDSNPVSITTPDNLAYVIYTSGSTGKPKGTLLAHRNVVRLFSATEHWFGFNAQDVWTVFHSYAFDFSVWELYGALLYGGKAVIVPKDVARSPEDFHALLIREQVTVLNQTPSAFKPLMAVACESAQPLALRHVVFGGEALEVSSLKPWFDTFGDARPQLTNMYGITETTVHVSYRPIRLSDVENGLSSPIGEAIPDLSWFLLDGALNPVVPGAQGELMIARAGLARGYHNRPGLTAERFIPNPFDAEGGRLYRSGDLACARRDGVIEYAGRIDHQVKIRGFRIELGEIEARLHTQPGVRQVAVLAQDGLGGKQLVAYVVPADAAVAHDFEAQAELRDILRTALKASLQEHMVPAHLLFLDALPLTGNGKLDHKALPLPDASLLQGEYVAPQNELEQQLAGVWADVLKLDSVGVTDNFFELGGDSIISLQVVSRARQMNIQFTPKQLFQHQTVQGLATVARRQAGNTLDQGPVSGHTPLVPIQHWFFEQAIPARHHWNQSVMLAPHQPLLAEPLAAALQALVAHHDALRLRFETHGDEWQAEFAASMPELLWLRDVADAQALQTIAEQAQASLDLGHGPLLRAVLATLADGTQRLLLVIHHLVVDGVSWRVLLEDLQQAYNAAANADAVTLPGKTSSFKAWAERLAEHAQSPALQDELQYWQAQLQGVDASLPCDHADGANLERHATSVSTRLDAQWTRQLLQDAPAAYRTQINDLLLTALARVISRWTGQADVLMRLEGHGREDLFDDIDLTRTVGWFTSLYPVKLSPQPALADSLKAVKEQLRGVPDKGVGYGLLRYLGTVEARQRLAQLPVGEIVFNYLGQFDGSFDQPGGLFAPAAEGSGPAHSADTPLASLLAINGQVYGGELKLGWSFSREVFEPATIQRLADELGDELKALIAHCCSGAHGATPSDFPLAALSQAQVDALPVTAAQIADVYPLSPMQQGMLFHTLYEQGRGDYINQMRVDVEGLDGARFLHAWREAQQAHDILRSSFVWDGAFEQPLQIVHKQVEAGWRELDLSGDAALDAALDRVAAAEREQGFALGQAPLTRLVLVRTGADQHHLIYTNHHILMDGWSTSRLLGEVLQRYASQQLPSQAGRYRDYIGWLQRQDAQAAQAFWAQQLVELEEPTLLLPALGLGHRVENHGQGEYYQRFDRERTQRLEAFARSQRVTVNTVMQAAWLLLLQRYTGHAAVCFGATVAGRPAELAHVEEQIGLFINTLPVVGSPRLTQTVGEWLSEVQATNLALREFEHTPLNDVQRLAGLGGHALFDSLMVFENYPVAEALAKGAPSGLRFGAVGNHEQTNYPLTLLIGVGATLSVQFNYDGARWPEQVIKALAGHLDSLIDGMIASGHTPVSELPMLAADEQQMMVSDWNATDASFPVERSVQQLIEAQVQATPDATALVFAGQSLTYAELNRRANRLARQLRAQGVGAESLVGIAMERSLEMVIGLLGVLKAGGAYVPFDPEYPQDRLAYMFEDSDVSLLLSQPHLTRQLPVPANVAVIALEPGAEGQGDGADDDLHIEVTPHTLAYVIYTSGSTGRPKGAGNTQQALVNRLWWMQRAYCLQAHDSVLQKTPFSFDVSVWEFFWPLITGARLVVAAPGAHRDPELLAETIREHTITTLHFVPSMLQAFMASEQVEQCTSLRRVVCSGEALPAELARQTLQRLPAAGLYNLYGPTEAAIDVTHWTCQADDGIAVPIGVPIDNLKTHILEDSLHPSVRGSAGELYLGGIGLARGYHQRPALTAERFVPDPFDETGGRLYRTGDLARYRPDGVIDYVGRIDHQVKIRGLRIELGEIESRLLEQCAVREAVVLAVDVGSAKQLVGYVVPADLRLLETTDAQTALRDQLREALKVHLPEFMVPTHLLLLASLPLTPNGKLDRKALPAPDASALQGAHVEPQSALEQQIATIWADVLKLKRVGVTDNFFELGGDSIVSLQVVSRARKVDIHFTPKELLQQQTVRGVAAVARVETLQARDQGPVLGATPLTPIQQWFFEQDIPQRHHWNQSVLLAPREPLDAVRLAAALQALYHHHDLLRATLHTQAGRWQAELGALDAPELLWVRKVETAQALDDLLAQAQCSLDLEQGPLLRAVLATLADGSQRLLLVLHHLVVDGVSWRVLLEDLQQAYRLRELPAKTTSFKAWTEHLQHYAAAPRLQDELAYWQRQLHTASDMLPCDHPQGRNLQRLAVSVNTRLDQEWTRKLLQDSPAAYRTQINDLLLTALARVISRWTARPEVLVRLEGHGREALGDDLDLTRTVGWFTSLYPLALTARDDLAASIKGIKEQIRAVPDKGLGYGVLRYLGNDAARAALRALPQGEILFNYLGQFDGSFDEADALFVPARESAGQPVSDEAPLGSLLTVNGQVYGGELQLSWSFSRERFDTATVQRLADDYQRELQALIAHCCEPQHRGVTPSDFPLAQLTQLQLDGLPVPVAQIADVYPLSPMQQGMLFYSLQDTEAALYINQTAVEVQGLDVERFVSAWQQVIARHDILRTGFVSAAHLPQPLQVVRRQVQLPVQVLDWRDRTVSASDLKALAAHDAAAGFDLAAAPLMRLTLVQLGEDRLHLIWSRHHILMDGWSNARLLGEVLQAYHGHAAAPVQAGYGAYIRWLDEQPQAQLESFWTDKLRSLDGATLLAGSIAPQADASLTGHDALYLNWDATRTRHLREQAQRLRVTPNTLVQAAWLLLLQRFTGQSTVCFGATVAGRPASLAGADEMLGLFINTLPVVQTPQPQQRVSDWLQALQAYNLELRDHEHAALADVQRWAGRPGQPLFDSIVVFENFPVDERLQQSGGGTLRFGEVSSRDVTNYAMDLAVHLTDTFSVEFLYLRGSFSAAAVEVLRGSFEQLLSGLLDHADEALGSLDLLTMGQAALASLRNGLQRDERALPLLASRIAEHAQAQPDAVAVVCADQQLTYAELDQRANRLAHLLLAQGVRPETTVGIALERSVEVIVAFLAVMKTGAAYVPLDIDYPAERLAWIVEDSAMHLLITSTALRPRFSQVQRCVALDEAALEDWPVVAPEVSVQPDNLAYLIYTSGSTGKPKGVAVSHEQIRMHCQAIAGLYEMDTATRELLFMSFAFDGAQERWLSTLSSGGCLVVRDNRLWSAEETFDVLHAQRIDIACFPPAYLQQLAEYAESQASPAPPVRIYCFGGDAVADALFEQVKRSLRPQWLTNGYGPTETVVTPLLWKVPVTDRCEAVYAPIGQRVGQRTLHVLDADLNPLPDGVAGELYIGGEGVARGYHQRPGLTAERFVADPFGSGMRLYRTGDRVRRRADGVIDFIGRLDNQLKIRGFRIEPGEIEARLRNLDDVRDAVVVAREVGTGKQLLGYVVTGSPATTAEQLREALRGELPDYMVPAQLVLLPALPLTPNGKVDRQALPAPDFIGQRQHTAPRNAIERALAAIWQEVLEVPSVGVEDNFFELGGDSLRVLKMLSKVRAAEDLPIELKLRDVIARPTIGELSGYSDDAEALDPLLPLNSRVPGVTPLFCLHAGFGTVFDYEPLARRLEGRCTVYGLQCRMLLDHTWEDDSIQSMAIDYAQYIRQKQPDGPYQLAGWSLGGTLAVLVAQELESQGQEVALLGLVDSFVPEAGLLERAGSNKGAANSDAPSSAAVDGDGSASDWSADLGGFLGVMLGVPVEVQTLPAGSSQSVVEGVIALLREAQATTSVYAGISTAELAHTFIVAMRLKALSQQMAALPQTQVRASCWWASSDVDASWILGSGANVSVAAGHYDILQHAEVLEGLAGSLPLYERVDD